MTEFVMLVLDFLRKELIVVLTAAMPVIELRGAIPVGLSLGMSPLHATLLSLLGSMLPVPFILFGTRPVFNYLKKTRLFRRLVGKITDRALNSNEAKIKKYGTLGLVVIVAIPLPGTGVWSGSLVAALLGIRFKWAFPAIFAGNVIAAVVVLAISYGVKGIF